MAGTKTSYQLTVYEINQSGTGGYWWVGTNSLNEVAGLSYSEGTTAKTGGLWHANDFTGLLGEMITNSIGLPQNDINVDIEKVANKKGLLSNFEPPKLTNAHLLQIAGNFDKVDFCKKMGAYTISHKMIRGNHINFSELSDILIYLGQKGRVVKNKVMPDVAWLKNNNNPQGGQPFITQSQYDAFESDWNTLVENE